MVNPIQLHSQVSLNNAKDSATNLSTLITRKGNKPSVRVQGSAMSSQMHISNNLASSDVLSTLPHAQRRNCNQSVTSVGQA